MISSSGLDVPREMTAAELDKADLLRVEPGVEISRFAVFVPADAMGSLRVITVLAGAVIGAFVMGVMNNGMSILGVGIDLQQVIKGLVLLAAVFLDVYYKNKA